MHDADDLTTTANDVLHHIKLDFPYGLALVKDCRSFLPVVYLGK